MYLSVVIPCFNEEQVIQTTYGRLRAVLDNTPAAKQSEIVFVDDGSTDGTFPILDGIAQRDSLARVIRFSRNFGHEAATSAGLHNAGGELVVIMDADLQDPPELIPLLIERYNEGDCNVVYGLRARRQGETVFKKVTSKMFYRLMRWASDLELPVDVGDFRLMDRAVVDAFGEFSERRRFVRGLLAEAGFRQVPLEYTRAARAAGDTKYSVRSLMRLAFDVLLSHSTKPLRVAMGLGFLSILIGLGLVVYAVIGRYAAYVAGWASTIVTIVFFGGVQLFTICFLSSKIPGFRRVSFPEKTVGNSRVLPCGHFIDLCGCFQNISS